MNKLLMFLRFGRTSIRCPYCNTPMTVVACGWTDVRLRCPECDWWVNAIGVWAALDVVDSTRWEALPALVAKNKELKAQLEAEREQLYSCPVCGAEVQRQYCEKWEVSEALRDKGFNVAVKDKGGVGEFKHYSVPEEVYMYIQQLENAVLYPAQTGIRKAYPERFPQLESKKSGDVGD